MNPSDMKEVTNQITNALDLKEHLQKTIKKLSAGIKRKVSFALSMLGNPQITLQMNHLQVWTLRQTTLVVRNSNCISKPKAKSELLF